MIKIPKTKEYYQAKIGPKIPIALEICATGKKQGKKKGKKSGQGASHSSEVRRKGKGTAMIKRRAKEKGEIEGKREDIHTEVDSDGIHIAYA